MNHLRLRSVRSKEGYEETASARVGARKDAVPAGP